MSDTGQVNSTAAEVYDEFFLKALFAAWAPQLVEAAGLRPGMRVVDVACGTGVLAIEAVKATCPGGSVVGVDLNPGMLAVARSKSDVVEWVQAPAEALPFANDAFDAVVSQFGLMFFEDKRAAVTEMWRVLSRGGRLVVAVWDSLEHTPGYAGVTAILARLFGTEVASLLESPYSLGDPVALDSLLTAAGVAQAQVQQLPGEAKFASIRSWMHSDVRGWTLADQLDDAQYERLVSEAERELNRFVQADGSVRFAHPALVATAIKS